MSMDKLQRSYINRDLIMKYITAIIISLMFISSVQAEETTPEKEFYQEMAIQSGALFACGMEDIAVDNSALLGQYLSTSERFKQDTAFRQTLADVSSAVSKENSPSAEVCREMLDLHIQFKAMANDIK